MSSTINDFRSIPLLVKIPKGTVAFYRFFDRSDKENKFIFFDEDKLFICYQLLRFRYFDFEIAEDVSHSIHGTNLRRWWKSLVGSNHHPLSYERLMKDGRVKIYYFNKPFVSWLLQTIVEFIQFQELFSITERQNSIHSFQALGYGGGAPGRVNEHDLMTRKLTASILKKLGRLLGKDETSRLSLQVSFPVARNAYYVVPDSTIFIGENRYFIEYDNYTETHSQILSKLIRYVEEEAFYNSMIFFAFKTRNKNTILSKRVTTFLNYAEKAMFDESLTINAALLEKGIRISGIPVSNAAEIIASNIYLSFCKMTTPHIDKTILFTSDSSIENILSISISDLPGIDYILEYEDDLYMTSYLPIIYLRYGHVGEETRINQIVNRYSDTYSKFGIVLHDNLTSQHQQFSDDRVMGRLVYFQLKGEDGKNEKSS